MILCQVWNFRKNFQLIVRLPKKFHRWLYLKVFCDASQKAYASSIYVRTVTEGNVNVHLLVAKTGVAPPICLSIPWLIGTLWSFTGCNFGRSGQRSFIISSFSWIEVFRVVRFYNSFIMAHVLKSGKHLLETRWTKYKTFCAPLVEDTHLPRKFQLIVRASRGMIGNEFDKTKKNGRSESFHVEKIAPKRRRNFKFLLKKWIQIKTWLKLAGFLVFGFETCSNSQLGLWNLSNFWKKKKQKMSYHQVISLMPNYS